MSAQTRIMTTEESETGFNLLKDIIAMVKDPDAIDEAYERRRLAAQMTDDEVSKANAARGIIVQADALRDEFKQREDALTLARSEHEKNVNDFGTKVSETNAVLLARSNDLDSLLAQHTRAVAAHESAKAQFEQDKAIAKAERDARDAELTAKASAIADADAANLLEHERLTNWEAKLKAKANRLAAEAQKDD